MSAAAPKGGTPSPAIALRRSRSFRFRPQPSSASQSMPNCSTSGRRRSTWSPLRRCRTSGCGTSPDSLQVQAAAREARLWVDLGSGAGFPGLVTAIRLADDPRAKIHLIEADQRKCAFLREVSRETGAAAVVHAGRIEKVVDEIDEPIEAVSARALAPLPDLIGYAGKFLEKGALGLFLKGQDMADELTRATATSRYQVSMRESVTSPSGRLVTVVDKAAGTRPSSFFAPQ